MECHYSCTWNGPGHSRSFGLGSWFARSVSAVCTNSLNRLVCMQHCSHETLAWNAREGLQIFIFWRNWLLSIEYNAAFWSHFGLSCKGNNVIGYKCFICHCWSVLKLLQRHWVGCSFLHDSGSSQRTCGMWDRRHNAVLRSSLLLSPIYSITHI